MYPPYPMRTAMEFGIAWRRNKILQMDLLLCIACLAVQNTTEASYEKNNEVEKDANVIWRSIRDATSDVVLFSVGFFFFFNAKV